jgi:PAS domain-containing protein
MDAKASKVQVRASIQPERLQDIRLIVDTIPALAWSALPDGSADFFNQRWLEYTGFTTRKGEIMSIRQKLEPTVIHRSARIPAAALVVGLMAVLALCLMPSPYS